MKLIIAGSRSITDVGAVFKVLNSLAIKPDEVVSGCCHGPDAYGEWWAKRNNIPVKKFPADWDQWGKKAGFIRNKKMALYADELIAFRGAGKSNGTDHMIQQMEHLKKPTTVIHTDKP